MTTYKVKLAFIFILLFLFLYPSLLFAVDVTNDPIYDASGLSPYRDPLSMMPFEHIDTFTGGITLTFTDARLPGNGGLDLVIQRTFNSKNVCNGYTVSGSTEAQDCYPIGNNSWMGLGWTLHFGRVIDPFGSNPVIEMQDGSQHKTFQHINYSSKKITKDYWLYEQVTTSLVMATYTNGTKIYFGHGGPSVATKPTLYATKIEDTHGNVINIVYKNPYAQDEIIDYVEDTTGRKIYFYTTSVHYDQKLTKIEGAGLKFTYAYESIDEISYGRLIGATPAVGDPWTFTYGSLNQMTSITSPGGGKISYTDYDLQRFVVNQQENRFWVLRQRQTNGRGIPSGTWNFTYQSGSNYDTTTVNDPCGRTITYQHYGYGYNSTSGNIWKIGSLLYKAISGEETTNYTWGKSSAISSEADSTRYSMDDDIWVPKLTAGSITRGSQTYTTNYSNFDFYGNPGTISESGDVSRTTSINYWYNTSQNIVHKKPSSETVSGSFSGSFTTNYSYNSDGQINQLNKYGVTTNYDYFSNGNLEWEKDANGYYMYYWWDKGVINKITTSEYTINRVINTSGTIASETNGRGNTTYFTYDSNLRLKSIDPPAGNTTSYAYASDNSYKKENRGSFDTYYYYDGFGRPTGTSNSKGVDTAIDYKSCGLKNFSDSEIGDKVYYDNFGRIKQVVHKDGNDIDYSYSGSNVTMTNESSDSATFTYKAFGNPDEKILTAVNDTMSNTTTYGRNMLGSLTSITQPGITTRTFHYNSKNFMDYEIHPETGTINYTRDNVGNMKSRSDSEATLNYTYDGLNRLKKISISGSCSGCSIPDINFVYDNADNRTSMSGPFASIAYTNDSANRLTQKRQTVSGHTYYTDYNYDGNDNITDIYYPTGLHVTYGYNSYNEVTSASGFGGSVSSFSYNLASQPTSFSYSNSKSTTLTYTSRYFANTIKSSGAIDIDYDYYSRGNIQKITNNLYSSKTQNFDYDDLDRLTDFDGVWESGSFTYSSSGNRGTKNVGGSGTTYSYSSNRLSSASGAEAGTYSYYGNGNLKRITEAGVTYDLGYDGFGNLIEFESGGSPLAEYEYDGDGMRVKKTVPCKTIIYHYDQAGAVISETDDNGVKIANYIYANGKLVAKVANDAFIISTAPDDTTCDGVDDDCDGLIDEDYAVSSSNCGIGACASTGQLHCQSGQVVDTCTPGTPASNDSVCNGIDDDCNGQTDEDYIILPATCGTGACASTGQLLCQNGAVYNTCVPLPPAPNDATCNGIDDDCNGQTDEDYPVSPTNCGTGACFATGQLQCQSGTEINTCTQRTPLTEGPYSSPTCFDSVDNDCDGLIDVNDPACPPPPTWTDDPIIPGETELKAVHITELRNAVNLLRSKRGFAPYNWTDPSLTPQISLIRAVHINELRTAIDQAIGAQSWTDNPIQPQITMIKAVHIQELRNAVQNAW